MVDIEYRKKKDGWMVAVNPPDEKQRLMALRNFCILDTEPDKHFDNITQLVAKQFKTAFSLVSLVDDDRQWFKSAHGIDAKETPRDMAFCAHAIWSDEPLVVLDAKEDERFCNNPLVDGEPYIRFYAGMPLITESGHRLGTLCAIDTQPRQEFGEDECEFLRSMSELVVDEMTLHLANIELQDRSDAKTSFLANMSHEIRTPMNGVMGMANMLGKTELSSQQKEYLNTIMSSGESLLGIINDVLDVSKIEAGEIKLGHKPFNLFEALDSVRQLFWGQASEKNIELLLEYSDDMPKYLVGDMLRIKQICTNLVNNAIKFTSEGEVAIGVDMIKRKRDGAIQFRIFVRDTGIGIEEDEFNSIFDKFCQSRECIGSEYIGTGLGLSISKTLAEIMGGSIVVSSEVGCGSQFIVELALPQASESDVKQLSDAVKTDIVSNKTFDACILVVEDNRVNQMVIQAMLECFGCKVDMAADGIEAMKLIEQNEGYDLVFMDCLMPHKNGYETAQEIRKHKRYAHLNIIALAANAFDDNQQACFKAGMNDFLSKPVDEQVLFKMLDKWLGEEHSKTA